ncbi:hypothetical protein [Thermococcus sp.]|uniref:hypothetical protein n=1 Tax=Thermococcus sp. TaxID=35749 RepID=UPI0025D06D7E|nr:hypothetical protein [Thermococcus sp.]
MTATDWKKRLREEGVLEIEGFRIELTLDNTFMDLDYILRIIVYDERSGRWHVLRNPISRGKTLEENWDNAVGLLERIAAGRELPMLGDEEVSERLAHALLGLSRIPNDPGRGR